MNPWLMIVVIAVAVFISSMFRAQQRQRPPVFRKPPPREPTDEPPNSADIPAVLPAPKPLRRVQPPPLPRIRKTQRIEIQTAAPVLLPVPAPSPPAAVGAAVSPPKPRSRTALSLRDLLKDPQMLGTAIVLREILDEPLCRRRPKRHL